MGKTIIKGLIIVISFFGLWFLLSQIDFVKHFKVREISNKTESSIGDIIWEDIERNEDVVYDETIISTIDSLLLPLCEKNDIERDSLKVHILINDEINAFALPDNHLIIYSGLIKNCKSEEALLGVLGHEIAHLKKNHVMKKLSKEIGFSVLLSMTGSNAQLIKEVLHSLSSSAYDRSLEKEADIESVNYLLKADIDPKPFADFMYDLSLENESMKYLSWVSTHPESEERAKYILNYLKNKKITSKKILNAESWEQLKKTIKDNL